MTLTLTRNDVTEYARKNQYAMLMLNSAGEDYIASRCCILNGLLSGFPLAAQALEKILKAFIYLETGAKTTLRGNDRHNPYALKTELANANPRWHSLDRFDVILKKLHDHYQSRYYDNQVHDRGASSEELAGIDELWVHLVDVLPMPDEAKYRTKFFADVCEERLRPYCKNYHWATQQNAALVPKLPLIMNQYKKVVLHLYPPN